MQQPAVNKTEQIHQSEERLADNPVQPKTGNFVDMVALQTIDNEIPEEDDNIRQ